MLKSIITLFTVLSFFLSQKTEKTVIFYTEQDIPFAHYLSTRIDPVIQQKEVEFGLKGADDEYKIFIMPSRRKFFSASNNRFLPPWAVGSARPPRNEVYVLSPEAQGTSYSEGLKTIIHETAHVLTYKKLKGVYIPRWLSEGIAVRIADEWGLSESLALGRMGVGNRIIPLYMLNEFFNFGKDSARSAYVESGAFVGFIINRSGGLAQLLESIRRSRSWAIGIKEATGLSVYELFNKWRAKTRRWYIFISIAGSGTTFWFLLSLILVLGYFLKRKRRKESLREGEILSDESLYH